MTAQTNAGNSFLFYHYEHLGSTMALTDLSGETVQEYAYDIYGKCISGDASYTRFLYNGKYGVSRDDNGLLYMRSRYYNTETRRFVNQDVVMGTITASQSLNRYSYVQGNPVSYTDPFGLSPEDAEQQEAQEAAENWGWHAFLDVLGMVPVVGVLASVANGLLYLSEGNVFMAVGEFCFAAADLILPAASALKLTGKAAKAAKLTAGTLRTAGYAIGSYTRLREAMQATAEFVLARDDGRFATDKFLTAASSYLFAGMGFGKAARSAGDAFRAGKELFGEAFSGAAKRISSGISGFASDNRGFVDLDVLSGKSSVGKGGSRSKFQEIFDLADNYTLSDDTFNNHILNRHGPNSTYRNKSHFNADFDIRDGINSTLKGDNFVVGPNTAGREGYIFEQTFTNSIGTNSKGKPLYTLKVVIDETGKVITAFPKK